MGKTDLDIFPAELANQYYEDEQTLMKSGQPLNREETVVNPRTGEKRWVQTTKVPLRDKQGAVVGLMGISRDITDRKQAEEGLCRAHRRTGETGCRAYRRDFTRTPAVADTH